MTVPTLDELKAEIEALPPGEGYDSNGDPRLSGLIDELVRQDWAEVFRAPSGVMKVRKRDPRERETDFQTIDALMRKHRVSEVRRNIGQTLFKMAERE